MNKYETIKLEAQFKVIVKGLEEKIKRLGEELVEHVDSPHYFSGHQEETVRDLRKRLGL